MNVISHENTKRSRGTLILYVFVLSCFRGYPRLLR